MEGFPTRETSSWGGHYKSGAGGHLLCNLICEAILLNSTMYLLIHCLSFMERWSSWCSASPTGSCRPKLVWSSRTNSLKSSCQSSQRAGFSVSRRSGSNHSKAIPFKYNCTKVTLVHLIQKALAQSWKLNLSCTRKTWSIWESVLSNWSGSQTLVRRVGSEEG